MPGAAKIGEDKKGSLFRSFKKGDNLTPNPMTRSDVLYMIKRRVKAAALPCTFLVVLHPNKKFWDALSTNSQAGCFTRSQSLWSLWATPSAKFVGLLSSSALVVRKAFHGDCGNCKKVNSSSPASSNELSTALQHGRHLRTKRARSCSTASRLSAYTMRR